EDPSLPLDGILSDFKTTGIQSVSLEPDTISSLERKGLITAVSTSRMREHLLLTQQDPLEAPFDKPGLFIHSNGAFNFEETTIGFFEEKFTFTVNDEAYTYIPGAADKILSVPVGYDPEVIAAIKEAGLMVVPRLGDYSDEAQTERMIEELLSIKEPGIEKILFSGTDVPAASDPERLKEFGEQLKDAGYGLMSIEFAGQKGLNQLAYINDLNLVRLHSLAVEDGNIAESADKIVRAAKERNMRAFFLNLTQPEYNLALTALQELQADVNGNMPDSFVRGESRSFDTYSVPLWQTAMALLGAMAFLTLAAQYV